MRRITWTVGAWIVAAALAAGCNPSPLAEAQSVCTTLCRCQVGPLPSAQHACVDECVGQLQQALDQGNVPQSCFDCIYAHANECPTIMTQCVPQCSSGGGGGGDDTGFADAEVVPPPIHVVDAGGI